MSFNGPSGRQGERSEMSESVLTRSERGENGASSPLPEGEGLSGYVWPLPREDQIGATTRDPPAELPPFETRLVRKIDDSGEEKWVLPLTRPNEERLFNLQGMVGVIHQEHPESLRAIYMGKNLTQLGGLALNTSRPALYQRFISPWANDDELQLSGHRGDFVVPRSYRPMRRFANLPPAMIRKAHDSTLFYMFYAMPNDAVQIHAAEELYARDWAYHKTLQIWVRRPSSSSSGDPDALEYWDQTTWARRALFRDYPRLRIDSVKESLAQPHELNMHYARAHREAPLVDWQRHQLPPGMLTPTSDGGYRDEMGSVRSLHSHTRSHSQTQSVTQSQAQSHSHADRSERSRGGGHPIRPPGNGTHGSPRRADRERERERPRDHARNGERQGDTIFGVLSERDRDRERRN